MLYEKTELKSNSSSYRLANKEERGKEGEGSYLTGLSNNLV